ncbi:MAG: GTP-binding protein [Actinobacteria bacterium]|nr:GTP-binding protein [Actinomycetota bacterium]
MNGVIIIGGFLGAGKTSVLLQFARRLTETAPDKSNRLAIIENEIGEVGVDDQALGFGYTVDTMLSGCVCCTLSVDLVNGLRALQADLDPDYVVLETTGVASPGAVKRDIVEFAGLPVRTCCVVDAKRWRKYRKCMVSTLLESQLVDADVILVTKGDLVDEEECAFVEESVREFNESAALYYVNPPAGIEASVLDALLGGM